ncbi:MAG: response regulator, partial [Bacteroidales bacterium]|nr:response regulator [Bacteroidales bacterium]
SVLSYVSTARNTCRYIMRGLDKEWTETSSNQIEFKNLSPGDYTLTVYGINNDGYESSEPAVLHISIAPPWWLFIIAILVHFLIIVGAVIFFMAWWNRRLAEQYRKKEEENAIAQEQEAYKSKIRFFTNLVHEIRTPLSMITLPLERLKEETRRDDKYIQIIDKNVEYLLSVSNQLLEFQKIDSNKLELNKTEFHIKKLLDDLRKQFDTAGSKDDVTLTMEAPEDDMVIYADKDRVRTILINLLNNAVKHAVSRIGIALTYGEGLIEVRVDNDGTPIPANEKEKIFDLFYQVKGSNNAALGTGIGLSFSKQLAQAHGGRLVLNESESGASFSLILPLEKAPATTFFENMNKVVDQAVTFTDDTLIDDKDESCTILVVEDNPGLLKLVSDSLGRWYNVLSAACGEDALKLLESNDVTIVVSDVMMPGISGIELCQQMRSDINTSHIPVILLTAKTTVEAKVEGMEAGAVVYMEKPFSMRQLHLQIESLRSLRRALGEEKDLQAVASGESGSAADFALGTRDMEFIEKLNKFVEERIKVDGCNVDTVAEEMCMSRRNFHRKVIALFGMTPNNYILKYKMQMAAKLLNEGYRVSEVSDMLNFSASSYFAKCFKAEFGVNPKDFVQ